MSINSAQDKRRVFIRDDWAIAKAHSRETMTIASVDIKATAAP